MMHAAHPPPPHPPPFPEPIIMHSPHLCCTIDCLPPLLHSQYTSACACPEAVCICSSESAGSCYAAADGVQYLRDLCMTLCYFLQAYPSGAQLLLQGQAGIVMQLTSLHDDLVPQMARAVTSASQNSQPQAAQVSTCTRMGLWASLLIPCTCNAAPEMSYPAF